MNNMTLTRLKDLYNLTDFEGNEAGLMSIINQIIEERQNELTRDNLFR